MSQLKKVQLFILLEPLQKTKNWKKGLEKTRAILGLSGLQQQNSNQLYNINIYIVIYIYMYNRYIIVIYMYSYIYMCVWVTWCSQKRQSFCKQRTSRIRIVSFSAVAPRPMLMEHMATHGWMACETFRFTKALKVLLCGVYGLKLHTWDFHRCFLFFLGGREWDRESRLR